MITIRAPVAAGTFYNLNPEMLKKQIESCFKHKLGPKGTKIKKIIAAVVPHAGYMYSGPIAAWVYSRIEKANYIILGPNHTGSGAKFATYKKELWKTPLGEVAIDESMVDKLMKECKILEYDVIPHMYEHSIEVQLPFLQYRFGNDFKFVPISIMNEFADETLLESCSIIGKGIAKVLKKEKEKWIVIATSDFSHYINHKLAKEIDLSLIRTIKKMNEKIFFEKITERNASVCGFGPIAVAMIAAKELGAKKADLLKYATSGDMTEEFESVVGYASIIIY
jgi:AmmeMemoRadiSam system protein B